MSAELHYRRIRELKDVRFDVDQIHKCGLMVHVGSRDCQIGVVDQSTGRLVYLGDYAFSKLCSPAEQLLLLQRLFDTHRLMSAGFWRSVSFAFKSQQFVQMPEAAFVPEESVRYLRVVAEVDEDESPMYCKSSKGNVVTVFAVNKDILSWIRERYPSAPVKVLHQSAGLIEGVCATPSDQADPLVCLYLDRFRIHIALARQGALLYYNCFPVREFSDYVKYTMMALQAVKLKPESARVALWGYVSKSSAHFMELSRYIRHLSLGGRPDHLIFGHAFDELEAHNFFDLYSLYRLSATV